MLHDPVTPFARSDPFTIGLEEELLLVEPGTLELAPISRSVLGSMAACPPATGEEAYAASIELRSSPSTTVAAATRQISDLRAQAIAAGATLLGVGIHPDGQLGDAELVDDERYRHVAELLRGLIRRTPECALHVHVGMPDTQTAVAVFNGLRAQLPLLQGLSANSPWWFGWDSGLASARSALVRAYPGRGIPGPLRSFDHWEELAAAVLAAGSLDDHTYLWWDVRLHPELGTVEVRELDAQSSLDEVVALGALVRALAREAAEMPLTGHEPSEALTWSAFRAARDGVEAAILDDGVVRPLRDVARAAVARLRPVARELGDEDALDGVEAILATGGGAGRQRAGFARGGMRTLLQELVEKTAAPAPRGARS